MPVDPRRDAASRNPGKMGDTSETDRIAGQRLGEKRQALVHPIIDSRVVIRELLVAMRYAKLVQPSHEPAGASVPP